MSSIQLRNSSKEINASISLDGSKSISNRVLIIKALCKDPISISGLGISDDIQRLEHFFTHDDMIKDAGPAGTTFRFSTAYYAIQNSEQILTGSARMKQRPIGALVEALKSIGANIDYIEHEGYPPLKIGSPELSKNNVVHIKAGTSSQFITAMLLIGPVLPKGLVLKLKGDIVSRSYIDMTINVMRHFGAEVKWTDNQITVSAKPYIGKNYMVEADWSAASYHYAIVALAQKADLFLAGLTDYNIQGDSILPEMMIRFGIETRFEDGGIRLIKEKDVIPDLFEWDFDLCPDIAQTLAVICAAKGTRALFTGLHTLSIKETDRIVALQNELRKVGVYFSKLPDRFSPKSDKTYYMTDGKFAISSIPKFATYHDHRMAMAFAPLAMIHPIEIEDPNVVIKSYPAFWDDLKSLGFEVDGLY